MFPPASSVTCTGGMGDGGGARGRERPGVPREAAIGVTPALLELSAVRARYGGTAGGASVPRGLDGVDLTAQAGELIAIVGANGSGKSTLLRVIAGLVRIEGGSVRIAGSDLATHPDARRLVGILLQDPDDQLIASRLEDDVAFGPEALGLPSAEIAARVEQALGAVGLGDRASRSPRDLSGGERQRAALAGVLACRPRCLCLDEPTAHLDPVAAAAMRATIGRLRADGHLVLFSTHDMSEAVHADRVVVLQAGRVAADGPPSRVVGESAHLRAWGLEPPPAVVVAARLAWDVRMRGPRPLTLRALAAEVSALAAVQARYRLARPVGQVPPPGPTGGGGAEACESGPPATAARREDPPPVDGGLILCGVHMAREHRFGSGREAPILDRFWLRVAPGRCLCLLGRGGAGKTTATRIAAGLLAADRGSLTVDGVAVSWPLAGRRGMPIAVRSRVGVVFQRPEDQFFGETVWEEVAFGPRQRAWSAAAVRSAVASACSAVGLPSALWDRSPFSLSGGEKRRVAVAGILACAPRYLILDEPTAGLDAAGRASIRAVLAGLRDAGHGVLLVTHRMEDAAALADDVVVVDGGRVVASGGARSVLSETRLSTWGLEPPPAVALQWELHGQCAKGRGAPAEWEGALTAAEAADALARAGVTFAPDPRTGCTDGGGCG